MVLFIKKFVIKFYYGTGKVPLKAQQISKLHEKYIFQQNAFLSSEKDDFGSSLSFPGIDFD